MGLVSKMNTRFEHFFDGHFYHVNSFRISYFLRIKAFLVIIPFTAIARKNDGGWLLFHAISQMSNNRFVMGVRQIGEGTGCAATIIILVPHSARPGQSSLSA